jgi:uncharacterized lipoprotein NlpE involved in copper resistance
MKKIAKVSMMAVAIFLFACNNGSEAKEATSDSAASNSVISNLDTATAPVPGDTTQHEKIGDTLKAAAHSAKGKIVEGATTIKEGAKELGQAAAEKAKEGATAVKDEAKKVGNAVKEGAKATKEALKKD